MKKASMWCACAVLLSAGILPAVGQVEVNLSSAASTDQKYTTNALIGYVNAEPIFVMDMLRPVHDDMERLAKSSRSIAEFKIEARKSIEAQLKRHVSDILLLNGAKQSLSPDDMKKIEMFMNKERNDLLAKHGGSQAVADSSLRTVGSSFDKELADKKRRVQVDLIVQRELMPKIVVTRAMILDEYNRNTKKYSQDAEVDLHTITVAVGRFLTEPNPANPEEKVRIKNPTAERIRSAEIEAMNQARDLVKKIKGGADFAKLAEEHSSDSRRNSGGRWPRIKKGALADQNLEKLAFSLSANAMAEPLLIRDENDPFRSKVVIAKVGDVQEAKTLSFEEVQEKIRDDMRNRQYQELMQEYYNKLYKKAAIEAVDRMVDVCLEVAVSRYGLK